MPQQRLMEALWVAVLKDVQRCDRCLERGAVEQAEPRIINQADHLSVRRVFVSIPAGSIGCGSSPAPSWDGCLPASRTTMLKPYVGSSVRAMHGGTSTQQRVVSFRHLRPR
jgi:hypothetical protein